MRKPASVVRFHWAAAMLLLAVAGSCGEGDGGLATISGGVAVADEQDNSESSEEQDVAEHPFPGRMPAPSLDGGIGWINSEGPIDLNDLRGKFVVLDFWTYCCINCIHVLPELKQLERAYPREVVVIGVHSAKFEGEKESENIRDAVLRYEIEHPVINDANHQVWQKFGAQSWPTVCIIDPEGNLVVRQGGEIPFEAFDGFLKQHLPYYRDRGLIDDTPIKFDLEAHRARQTPLRYPGKVLADEVGGRLFISDSNHNRIVVTDLTGKLSYIIGSGEIGASDGDYGAASFDHPQGTALVGETLYVADTENHLLRKIDLATQSVTTIAGTGEQRRGTWPGIENAVDAIGASIVPRRFVSKPMQTALNSPWALLAHEDQLYIAMAGPHQIWKMPLDESEIGPYAGNGREDIVDGPLLPSAPYDVGYSSFAQPSGLATDGEWLYVADSEGSSVRAVPFDEAKEVRTVVGTAHVEYGRLFTFGDRDGDSKTALLQHALGVAYHDGQIYVADTYNNKIKRVDATTGDTTTLVGSGPQGSRDDPAEFDEPAGIGYAAGKLFIADTNNHVIRVVDLNAGNRVSTLEISGLEPPEHKSREAIE